MRGSKGSGDGPTKLNIASMVVVSSHPLWMTMVIFFSFTDRQHTRSLVAVRAHERRNKSSREHRLRHLYHRRHWPVRLFSLLSPPLSFSPPFSRSRARAQPGQAPLRSTSTSQDNSSLTERQRDKHVQKIECSVSEHFFSSSFFTPCGENIER